MSIDASDFMPKDVGEDPNIYPKPQGMSDEEYIKCLKRLIVASRQTMKINTEWYEAMIKDLKAQLGESPYG
jgi:hypothetical protein